MNKNPVKKLIEIVGTQAELARRCSVKPQSVSKWLKKKKIPAGRVADAVRACDGQMLPEELCPAAHKIIQISHEYNN